MRLSLVIALMVCFLAVWQWLGSKEYSFNSDALAEERGYRVFNQTATGPIIYALDGHSLAGLYALDLASRKRGQFSGVFAFAPTFSHDTSITRRLALPLHICCKQRAEPIPPQPHRFMTDINSSLGQQILDVPQRNGLAGFLGLGIVLPHPTGGDFQSGAFALTVPS